MLENCFCQFSVICFWFVPLSHDWRAFIRITRHWAFMITAEFFSSIVQTNDLKEIACFVRFQSFWRRVSFKGGELLLLPVLAVMSEIEGGGKVVVFFNSLKYAEKNSIFSLIVLRKLIYAISSS